MSNQTKPAPPKIVIAPDGCETYLTAGKEYGVTFTGNYTDFTGYPFRINDDDGDSIGCLERNCGFANGNWIIKEREGSHE